MISKISARTLRWTTMGAASALVLAFGLGTAQPASAEAIQLGKKIMPEVVYPLPSIPDSNQMANALTKEGFTNVANVTNEGNVYHAHAKWDGQPVKLTIDGLTGRVFDDENGGLTASSK